MPQVLRCQVILNPGVNTRLQNMNTWHIVTVGAATTLDAHAEFYADLGTFYQAIDAHLSTFLSGSAPLMRTFDLSEPKPRQPIVESNLATLTTAATTLPAEIACCLSYKGTYISGVSPKRKRGRIYIGPLASATIDSSVGNFTSTFRGALATAAGTLQSDSAGATSYRWVVYSPASDPTGEGTDVGSWDAVTEGWVDNEPDVLRSRSINYNTRSVF